MKRRIAIWAATGALVVYFWSMYILVTHQNLIRAGGAGWAILCVTCPIALAGRHPLSFFFVLAANAGTYALAGVIVETARRRYRIHSISN